MDVGEIWRPGFEECSGTFLYIHRLGRAVCGVYENRVFISWVMKMFMCLCRFHIESDGRVSSLMCTALSLDRTYYIYCWAARDVPGPCQYVHTINSTKRLQSRRAVALLPNINLMVEVNSITFFDTFCNQHVFPKNSYFRNQALLWLSCRPTMSSQAGPSRPRPRPPVDNQEDLLNLFQRLSVAELELLGGSRTPGAPAGDAELALRLAAEEVRAYTVFNNDREIATRLQEEDGFGNGFPTNGRINRNSFIASGAAATPAVPRQIVPPQPPTPDVPQTPRNAATTGSSQSQGGWFSWITGIVFGTPNGAAATTSQASGVSGASSGRLTGNNCVICIDAIRGVEIRAPCGHHYDKVCILDLFGSATRDESLYPPRCCRQRIPLASVQMHMTSTALLEFNEKSREFSTLKRIYCANPACSRFLGPQPVVSWFSSPTMTCTASNCGTITCAQCKNKVASSVGHRCNPNDKDNEVLALGRASGWARCPGCETLIELNHGCFHMTCRCKTEFCYLCKARWKSCACPQWDERRLLAAAEARADAQLGRQAGVAHRNPPAVPPRPPAVPQARLAPRPPAGPPVRVAPAPRPSAAPARAIVTVPPAAPRAPAAAAPLTFGTAITVPRPASTVIPSSATPATAPRQPARTSRIQSPPTAIRDVLPPTRPVSMSFATKDRDTLVRTWMERLRVDHDCQHEKFRYRSGGGRCETCHHNLPLYLFRCQGCDIVVCNRCRRNRL